MHKVRPLVYEVFPIVTTTMSLSLWYRALGCNTYLDIDLDNMIFGWINCWQYGVLNEVSVDNIGRLEILETWTSLPTI